MPKTFPHGEGLLAPESRALSAHEVLFEKSLLPQKAVPCAS